MNGIRMKPRVLVVDDDSGLRESLDLLLGEESEVISRSSGAQALELLSRQEIEVIITDFKMPEMNGLEFVAELNRRCVPVPYVLMLTGTPGEVSAKTPGASDLVVVLAKPFEPARLVKLVSQLGRLAINRRVPVPARV